jgi:hypothetical protein
MLCTMGLVGRGCYRKEGTTAVLSVVSEHDACRGFGSLLNDLA